MSEISPEALNLMYQHTNKWIAERVVILEAETKSLGILLSNLVDVEVERDKLREALELLDALMSEGGTIDEIIKGGLSDDAE